MMMMMMTMIMLLLLPEALLYAAFTGIVAVVASVNVYVLLALLRWV